MEKYQEMPRLERLSSIIYFYTIDYMVKRKCRCLLYILLYYFILTFKPTNVELERVCSPNGLLGSKFKSNLTDETIDTYSLLRAQSSTETQWNL